MRLFLNILGIPRKVFSIFCIHDRNTYPLFYLYVSLSWDPGQPVLFTCIFLARYRGSSLQS